MGNRRWRGLTIPTRLLPAFWNRAFSGNNSPNHSFLLHLHACHHHTCQFSGLFLWLHCRPATDFTFLPATTYLHLEELFLGLEQGLGCHHHSP